MHKSSEYLHQLLEDAGRKLHLNAKYFHYKNPDKFYIVEALTIIEATEEVGVIYRPLYEGLEDVTFLRPINDFLAVVEKDGESLSRFTPAT